MPAYMQPEDLKKHNLGHFDSWAGRSVNRDAMSFHRRAGYRLNTRFARFINVPELMQIFRQSADVQTAQCSNLGDRNWRVKTGDPNAPHRRIKRVR